MSRSVPVLRSVRLAAVGLGAAALLSGCFAPPAPVVVETPKPEPDFASIGGEAEPIDTSETVEPIDPGQTGYTALVDDLGVLTVTVPDTWTDIAGQPFTTDAGQEWASITAAPDIDGYLGSWAVPGLEIAATSTTGVTEDGLRGLLESISVIYGECATTVQEAVPYDDGFFTGLQSAFEECGSSGTSAFAITAMNAAGTQAIFVRAQITSDLDANEVYLEVVQSFDTTLGRAQSKG